MSHRDYYEVLTRHLVDVALPPDVYPVVHVFADEHILQNLAYKITGIHLLDTRTFLTSNYFRIPEIVNKKYDAAFEPLSATASDPHLTIVSYEWSTFIDAFVCSSLNILDIIFKEIAFAAPLMQEIQPYLLGAVNQSFIDSAWWAVVNWRNAVTDSERTNALFRGCQGLFLAETGEFDWDKETLFNTYIPNTEPKIAVEYLTRKLREASFKTSLPSRDKGLLQLQKADEVVARCRANLI